MLRKTKAIFPTARQRFKNLLIDVILDKSSSIEDFFTAVGKFNERGFTTVDRHKVLYKIISDKDLWEILDNKITEKLEEYAEIETNSLIVMKSPNMPAEARELLSPFIHSYLDSADATIGAIKSLRKLKEAL